MAKTKVTPRKVESFGNSTGKNLKTKIQCLKCDKKFASISSLRRHHKTRHEPTVLIFECRHCPATFTRKESARRHTAHKHRDETLQDYITKNITPRANAKPIKKWTPPMEARTIDWNKTKPVFKVRPASPKYHYIKKTKSNPDTPQPDTLAQDLYISSDSEDDCIYVKTTQSVYTTNQYGYLCQKEIEISHQEEQPSTSKDRYTPVASDSNNTFCLDELAEEDWDRQLSVKGVYNIFTL